MIGRLSWGRRALPGSAGATLLLAGVLLAPGVAAALVSVPEAELAEARTLRERIAVAVPDLQGLPRQRGQADPQALEALQQRLAGLQGKEQANPFFHWALGEVRRLSQGPEAARPSFEEAMRLAGNRAAIHWLIWDDFLEEGLDIEAEREYRTLQGISLTWGLWRTPRLAERLLRAARRATATGDRARALALANLAIESDPRWGEAYLVRAGILWGTDKTQVMAAAGDLAKGVVQAWRSPWTSYQLMGSTVAGLLLAVLLALLLYAAVLVFKYQPLLAHDLAEGRLAKLPARVHSSLALLLILLPLAVGLGLYWAALFALAVLAPYSLDRERVVASALLVLAAVLPLGYRALSQWHLAQASPQLAAAAEAEAGGRGEDLVAGAEAWAQGQPQRGLPQYYLGLVRKRRGELDQARLHLAQAASLAPRLAPAQVALGNVLYLQGNLEEAEAAYRRAVELQPKIASARANLGQLYAQRLQLDRANRELTETAALDPAMAVLLSRHRGQTSVLVDEPVDLGSVWGAMPSAGDAGPLADALWGGLLRWVPLMASPPVWLAGVAGLWGLTLWRRRRGLARGCRNCGKPFCRKCQMSIREEHYCPSCAAVFRVKEGVAAYVKVRRIREVEEWQSRQRRWRGILGLLFPGAGHLYAGHTVAGILMLLLALTCLNQMALLDLLAPALDFPSLLPLSVRWGLLGVPLLVLYVASIGGSLRARAAGGDGAI